MSSSIVTLVGDNLTQQHGRYRKWLGSVASNGCVYGVPYNANRVVEWNVTEKSSTAIGNDLNGKWWGGVEVNGKIYCMPYSKNGKVLKIDGRTRKVETLNTPFPESDFSGLGWLHGALGNDGKLYFYPYSAKRMLLLDPSDDSMMSVGQDFGEGIGKFVGTVKAMDGSLIGIPDNYKQVVKYDPNQSDSTTMIGDEAEKDFKCWGNGAVDANGNIFAVNRDGNIVRIDVLRNFHEIIQVPQSTEYGWYGAYAGIDGNIYFPPRVASRVLKLNVTTQRPSLVGEEIQGGDGKYYGGALDPETGVIHCFPCNADQILAIDTNVPDLSHQNANGGIHDSPHGDPDRLGYKVYAEGLSNVAQKVESPNSSLCVALYAPWGAGKTFLYNLIKEELEQRAKREEERIRKELDGGGEKEEQNNKEPGIHEHARKQSLQILYKSAMILHRLLCCRCLVTESEIHAESIATIMAIPIFWPLWIPIFLLSYFPVLIINSIAKSVQYVHSKNDSFLQWWKRIMQHHRNRMVRLLACCLYLLIFPVWLFTFLCVKAPGYVSSLCCRCFKCCSKSFTSHQDGENTDHPQHQSGDEELGGIGAQNETQSFLPQNRASQNDGANSDETASSSWDKVWNILTGQTSLHASMPFPKRGCMEKIRMLFLTGVVAIVAFFRGLWGMIPKMRCKKEDDINPDLTKYISIEFNAWQYNTEDEAMWASILEKMWSKVENEEGTFNVRLHRAKIALSGESPTDDITTKHSKREIAGVLLVLKSFLFLMLAVLGFAFIFIEKPDFFQELYTKIISQVIITFPFLAVFINGARNVVPYLLRSRGADIMNKVSGLDKHERINFSKRTGFMGEVKQEVDYLFDFIRTTYIHDDKLKARRPYRLMIFIDDLDRCNDKTIMQVLEAVVLFMTDGPVTCWLAIDSRLVVASIEKKFGELFTSAGLDGYKFLEKIVQLVFCIPDLSNASKINYLKKILEKKELDPLRIYRRGWYLKKNEISVFHPFADIFQQEKVTKDEAMDILLKLFDRMMDERVFGDDDARDPMVKSPSQVRREIRRMGDKVMGQQCEEEFLHYVSVGIQRVLGISSKETQSNVSVGETSGQDPAAETTSDDPDIESGLESNSGGLDQGEEIREDDLEGYNQLYQPMADEAEMESFSKYAEHFVGEPRKIKRIINSYMVSRFIADVVKPRGTTGPIFYEKLLKLIVLCEQWPYRMAWLMIVVENLQQERWIKDDWKDPELGESITSIMDRIKSEYGVESYDDISLMAVYHRVVRVLLRSPDEAKKELKRDGDPQVFEMLLSEATDNGDSQMKVKDIAIPDDNYDFAQQTLRPFVFNLQRHMMEKVQLYMDDCILHFLPNVSGSGTYLAYQMKSEFHNRKFPMAETNSFSTPLVQGMVPN